MDRTSPTAENLASRIRATFLSPARLPALISDRAPWIDVLLISTVIAVVSVATMPDEIFVEDMRDAVTRRGRPVEITSSPDVIGRWGRLMGMVATVWTHPVIPFVLAGIGFALFVGLFRGTLAYRQLLSLASHSMLIPALGTVIAIVVRIAAGADRGLGTWYEPGPDASLLLRAVLATDPFVIWMLLVFAIGVHGFDTNLSTTRAGALLVGGYLALVVGSTAILHPEARAGGDGRQQGLGVSGQGPPGGILVTRDWQPASGNR